MESCDSYAAISKAFDSVGVVLFGTDNYTPWAACIECALTECGALDFLKLRQVNTTNLARDGQPALTPAQIAKDRLWHRMDGILAARILNRTSATIQHDMNHHVNREGATHIVWYALRSVYGKREMEHESLQQRFMHSTIDPKASKEEIIDWLDRLTEMQKKLKAAGTEPHLMYVSVLLTSLGHRFPWLWHEIVVSGIDKARTAIERALDHPTEKPPAVAARIPLSTPKLHALISHINRMADSIEKQASASRAYTAAAKASLALAAADYSLPHVTESSTGHRVPAVFMRAKDATIKSRTDLNQRKGFVAPPADQRVATKADEPEVR